MPFLIDGHNLIPKMGLRLDALDDELMLIEQLNEFCRLSRRGQVEVYFDNAPPGFPETRKSGLVTAHFVRKPLIADEAIRLRLKRLKKAAKNWSVVSSDHRVQNDAKAAGAAIISSEEFARIVIETLRSGPPSSGGERIMSEHELEEWLKLFDNKKDHKFGQF
ncbi:MAG TPA: NYN domain-containing protein [Anaerolineales bacterium]|nr:NYN domain-containing protein [Anaerolineales bacterium]